MSEPSFGFATPLGGLHPALSKTVLAIGLYPPSGPAMSYPEDGPQRYTLNNALVLQAWAGPSLATQVTPWLSVGAGLQWSFLAIEQGLAAKVCLAETGCLSDDPTSDVKLDVEGRDMQQWSANVGVLLQPTPWLDIGASWQPGSSYEARGRLGVAFPEDFALANFIDATTVADEDIAIAVTLPQTVRLGAQFRPHPKARVELAGTWTQWSALNALTITDLQLDIPTTESAQGAPFNLPATVSVNDEVELPTGYTDSWSARLGGDLQVADWARLALGAHYETSAVPPATQGVNIVDGDKWGVGGGATFAVGKHLELDVAVAGTFLPSRNVTDSELDQLGLLIDTQNPEAGGVIDGKIVGNGAYDSRLTFLGVGATWAFGQPASATP
jgi:long-subunit fatty acid transport protein